MADSAAQVISVLWSHKIQNYIQMVAAALLIYEQVITLGDMITYLPRLLRPGILSLWNRVNMALMAVCFILRPFSSRTILSCDVSIVLWDIASLSALLLWTEYTVKRIYAVSGRNCALTVAGFLFGIVPFATNLYQTTRDIIQLWPLGQFYLCATVYRVPTSVNIALEILTRTCAVASDLTLVSVIWYSTARKHRRVQIASSNMSLSSYLWQSGTLHFMILLLLNLGQMILVARELASLSVGIEDYNPLPTLILPITSVIMERSTLALRKLADAQAAECSQAVASVDLENTIMSGSRTRPQAISISRWNMECLAADGYMPAPFGSMTSLRLEEQLGDSRARSQHREVHDSWDVPVCADNASISTFWLADR